MTTPVSKTEAAGDELTKVELDRTAAVLTALLPLLRRVAEKRKRTSR
jgi:hypothetical protein